MSFPLSTRFGTNMVPEALPGPLEPVVIALDDPKRVSRHP
jgi:hypothetical protein